MWYVGGEFTAAGDNAANNIAKWNGSSWSPLSSGMKQRVFALAISGSDVYAGGYFTTAGGVPPSTSPNGTGAVGSPRSSGMSQEYDWVVALAVSGSGALCGGLFTTAGGSAANNIAKWDGTNWSALVRGRVALWP